MSAGRPVVVADLAELVDRAVALTLRPPPAAPRPGAAPGPGAALLGIAGAPGSGKTTLALAVVAAVGARIGHGAVQHVPMDGFHLADVELERLGRRHRKGDPDTFDPDGYTALLARISTDLRRTVYAPAFDRDIEQPLAGAIAVLPSTRLVVTEGLYLLGDGSWSAVRALLDEAWFVDLPASTRTERLIGRHQRFGKSAPAATEWVARVDRPNAERAESTRDRADLTVPGDLDVT